MVRDRMSIYDNIFISFNLNQKLPKNVSLVENVYTSLKNSVIHDEENIHLH